MFIYAAQVTHLICSWFSSKSKRVHSEIASYYRDGLSDKQSDPVAFCIYCYNWTAWVYQRKLCSVWVITERKK